MTKGRVFFVVYAFVWTVAMLAAVCWRPSAPVVVVQVPAAAAGDATSGGGVRGAPERPSPPVRPVGPVAATAASSVQEAPLRGPVTVATLALDTVPKAPVATRGPSLDYHQVGVLYDDGGRVLPLYGRPTYRGSSRWQYFTATDGYQSQRLGLTVEERRCVDEQGCRELNDGDAVGVRELGGKTFKASVYEARAAVYDPDRV